MPRRGTTEPPMTPSTPAGAPPIPELPGGGGDPATVAAAPLAEVHEKPKRKHRKRNLPAVVEDTGDPLAKFPPAQVAALTNALALTFRSVSRMLVAARGNMYAFQVLPPADPDKVTAAKEAALAAGGTFHPAGQAEALAAAWTVPLAPYLLGEGSAWLAAAMVTVGVFGPMVAVDLATAKARKKAAEERAASPNAPAPGGSDAR